MPDVKKINEFYISEELTHISDGEPNILELSALIITDIVTDKLGISYEVKDISNTEIVLAPISGGKHISFPELADHVLGQFWEFFIPSDIIKHKGNAVKLNTPFTNTEGESMYSVFTMTNNKVKRINFNGDIKSFSKINRKK